MLAQLSSAFQGDKAVIALLGAAVGWLLAQGTKVVERLWQNWTFRRGLLQELEDIDEQIIRNVFLHQRQLQIAAKGGMGPDAPLPIAAPLFEETFKNAATLLNREQRLSYSLIHATVVAYNEHNKNTYELYAETEREIAVAPLNERRNGAVKVWGSYVVSLWSQAMVIRWHIRYHLDNRGNSKLPLFGPLHESYLRFLEELDKEVKKIQDGVATLDTSKLTRIFDVDAFDAISNAVDPNIHQRHR